METILLQENDAGIFDIVSTALDMEGYHVCLLSDQHEHALKMVRRHRPRLILLDCWLQNYSGKLCQRIKSHFPRVHIIAFSSDPAIATQYHSLGFDGNLQKPFDLDELYALVKKYMPAVSTHRKSATVAGC